MRNMRHSTVALTLAGLLLVAGVAVAQTPAGQSPQQPQQPQQEEQSVTGTVVSAESQLLVIRADSGQLRFDLSTSTVQPEGLQAGDRVRIHYYRASQMMENGSDGEAVRIERLDDAGNVESRTATERETARGADAMQTDDGAAAERSRESARAMPRTASNLPMTGIMGLLALVGAAGVGLVSRLF